MRTQRITIWQALLDGECHQIHKTEEQCWYELRKRNFRYASQGEDRWVVEAVEREVPIVTGTAVDLSATGGCGGVHIFWQCPFCDCEHCGDDDPNDTSPYLWFCERDRGIVLVEVSTGYGKCID